MKLSTLQNAVAALLRDSEELVKNNVAVLAENKGDVFAEINLALAKLSCCALVLTPRFKSTATDSAFPVGYASVVVQVFEKPLLNRGKASRVTALDAAEIIIAFLHQREVKDTAGRHVTRLVCEELAAENAGDTLAINVHFKTGKIGLAADSQT